MRREFSNILIVSYRLNGKNGGPLLREELLQYSADLTAFRDKFLLLEFWLQQRFDIDTTEDSENDPLAEDVYVAENLEDDGPYWSIVVCSGRVMTLGMIKSAKVDIQKEMSVYINACPLPVTLTYRY